MAVGYQKEGKIAVITLNRPEALNSFDPDQINEFNQCLYDFNMDENLWVAIVTAAGERAFSVGADIKTTLPRIQDSAHRGEMPAPAICEDMQIWKPIIAAVNGACLGGGFEVALACDIRIASETATFGFPEINLGLIPGWGGTQRLPRAVPLAKAAELLTSGRPIDAQEAYRIGLVNKVVPPAELMNEAKKMAETLLKPAPLAARAAKQAMLQGLNTTLINGLEIEYQLEKYVTKTEDFQEGRDAFIAKRKAEFKAK
ncbi:MAG: enoyl-CoA hydratase-related protein [Dehalococcoidia bacterium]|nr:enoyl-CoA hydratase-related protein [Dehalococcoidia bacterium]MDD5495048.1 enoyl-CoA hydratase-related protein [Dehalococcoidia bacterium]